MRSKAAAKPRRAPSTTIRVRDEIWKVPRGFGAAYQREIKRQFELIAKGKPGEIISVVSDLLALVGYEATREQIADWNLRKRVEAVIYAATEHARASDNPIQRHPQLAWLPDRPWQGPHQGRGAFAGPSGTPIPEAA